jgi:hypothetical protein
LWVSRAIKLKIFISDKETHKGPPYITFVRFLRNEENVGRAIVVLFLQSRRDEMIIENK